MKESMLAIGAVILIGAAVIPFVFERYEHHDFVIVECDRPELRMSAQLSGTPIRFEGRRSPYSLRIVQPPLTPDRSIDKWNHLLLEHDGVPVFSAIEIGMSEMDTVEGAHHRVTVVDIGNLLHRKYTMRGEVVVGGGRTFELACTVEPVRFSEWRVPFIDALMSV